MRRRTANGEVTADDGIVTLLHDGGRIDSPMVFE